MIKGKKKLLDEIMAENFQSLLKRTCLLKCNLHIQEVQTNSKEETYTEICRHIIVKILKAKTTGTSSK